MEPSTGMCYSSTVNDWSVLESVADLQKEMSVETSREIMREGRRGMRAVRRYLVVTWPQPVAVRVALGGTSVSLSAVSPALALSKKPRMMTDTTESVSLSPSPSWTSYNRTYPCRSALPRVTQSPAVGRCPKGCRFDSCLSPRFFFNIKLSEGIRQYIR